LNEIETRVRESLFWGILQVVNYWMSKASTANMIFFAIAFKLGVKFGDFQARDEICLFEHVESTWPTN
jgi:hypothetical protein